MRPVTDLGETIGAAEFAALMAPLGPWLPDVPEAPVGLAVSGGADSMALAVLARNWRRNVVAFVVDHGLRVASAAEARTTVARLAGLGIEAHLLTLEAFPSGRLQERARQARFARLEEACVARGCLDVLLAHHLHDQDETVAMRQRAGSGAVGLGGMRSAVVRGRVRVVRPLLPVPPERLRATLRAAGVAWVEDPSNQNRVFERVRWRQDLGEAERTDLRALRSEAADVREERERELGRLLADHARWHPAGWVFLGRGGMTEDGVSAVIRLVGGRSYPPARESVRRVVEAGTGSVGGVVVRSGGRFGDGIILVRERRGLEGMVPARSGVVWDGRWRLMQDVQADDVRVGALGRGREGLDARWLGVPALVLETLPALWRQGTLEGVADVVEGGNVRFVWVGGGV